MAIKTKTQLKSFFQTGDIPTENEYADFIDLDGPCFIANDRKKGLIYENGMMLVKEDLCWG